MLPTTYATHRRRATLPLAVLVLALPTIAAAQPARATCDRLRAEAEAEAALLYAPRLQAEGARTPGLVEPSDPSASAAELQARLSLVLSPVDMLRGRAVERVAAAECAHERTAVELERILAAGTSLGELEAAAAELAYLDQHMPEVDALVAEALDRLASQRTTALDVDELRGRRATMRHHASSLRHRRALLASVVPSDVVVERQRLDDLTRAFRASASVVQARQADLRGLSAWRFDVRGGVAGAERAEWFALVEVGYSLGGPWQRRAERRAGAARRAELDEERSPVVRLARLREAMRASVAELDADVRAIDEELATLRAERERLVPIDSAGARQLEARTRIAIIELEARRTSLAALAAARRPFAGAPP